MNATATKQQVSFQLKGSLFTLSVLQLHHVDLDAINADITDKITLAPNFFNHAPIVIDITKVAKDIQADDFTPIKLLLESHDLVPVGIHGADSALHNAIRAAGFAVLGDSAMTEKVTTAQASKSTIKDVPNVNVSDSAPPANDGFRLITKPVRSGQQVYAQGGDLVVVAPVSPGAELLADGNIHVYGSLRGRALAGVNGNLDARIFCNELDAELVAIAGHYRVLESIPQQYRCGPVQILLEDEQLKFALT